MLESILQLPDWLIGVWGAYKDVIMPVLVTLGTAIASATALNIKANAKANAVKSQLQLDALKSIASKEDVKPEMTAQTNEIESLKQTISYLVDIVNLAFQNSDLDPEIKENLTAIVNKIQYGTESEMVKDLKAENEQLNEQVVELKEQLETVTEADTVAETAETTRQRR